MRVERVRVWLDEHAAPGSATTMRPCSRKPATHFFTFVMGSREVSVHLVALRVAVDAVVDQKPALGVEKQEALKRQQLLVPLDHRTARPLAPLRTS